MTLISFSFKPYIAIVGDIVESRKIDDRGAIQKKLNSILLEINQKHFDDIASKFGITLGDEFQGLLRAGSHTVEIIETIEREMHPTRVRFGIGIGRITTDIDPYIPLGADGPAFHIARNMIEEIKTSEKRNMESKPDMKIQIEENTDVAELINAIFSLRTIIKSDWTDRQREVIVAYEKNGGTQSDVAKMLGINQSNVQKALSKSNFYAYNMASETLAKILSNIREQDV